MRLSRPDVHIRGCKVIQIGCTSQISVNGVPVGGGHNTILSAGFDVMGRRCFQPQADYSTQIAWIRYDLSAGGNKVFAATYSETSPTVHQLTYTWVSDVLCHWTCIHAMFANSTSDSYIAASRATFDQDLTSATGANCTATFTFTLSGPSAWQSDGFKTLGHRCFNSSNTYGPINYYSFDGGTNRTLGTYANVSNTVHDLNTTIATTEASSSSRLYNASSSGQLCFSQTVDRNMVAGQPFKLRMTVSQ